jgi:hypothetical protein
LPAGSYSLILSQPALISQITTTAHYCGVFSYSLVIADAALDPQVTHSNCGMVHQLPWELNSVDGASVPYPSYKQKLLLYKKFNPKKG